MYAKLFRSNKTQFLPVCAAEPLSPNSAAAAASSSAERSQWVKFLFFCYFSFTEFYFYYLVLFFFFYIFIIFFIILKACHSTLISAQTETQKMYYFVRYGLKLNLITDATSTLIRARGAVAVGHSHSGRRKRRGQFKDFKLTGRRVLDSWRQIWSNSIHLSQ